jgi:hypothetical protein
MAEADRLDPGWRFEELEAKRDRPPDAENAALYLMEVARQFPKGRVLIEVDRLLGDLPPEARLHQSQHSVIRSALTDAGPALAAAYALPRYTRTRYPVTWRPDLQPAVETCQETRPVAAWLRLDALVRAEAGDHAGALEACRVILHASWTVGDEPYWISQVVRTAIRTVGLRTLERVLAQGEPPADRLAEVQHWLEVEDAVPLLLIGARANRAVFHHLTPGLYDDQPLPDRAYLALKPSTNLTRSHAIGLRYHSELVEIFKLPEAERPARRAALVTTELHTTQWVAVQAVGVYLLEDSIRCSHALTRSAITAIAAERFRQANGRWPDSLAELAAARLLRAVPIDPFTLAPLHYRRVADGLLIYSTGPDKADDGGTFRRNERPQPGTDWGMKVWDLPKRRQPPVPPPPPEPDDDRPGPP